MHTRRLSLALATTLTALAVSSVGATASNASYFGIHVATADNPDYLTFLSAKCHVHKRSGFEAVAVDRGWNLTVKVHPFTGFHRYQLDRGHFNGTFLSLQAPTGEEYASDFVPPAHEPGGGQIDFSGKGGGLMSAGFGAMFNADGTDAVDVGGVLRCHYPRRKHR